MEAALGREEESCAQVRALPRPAVCPKASFLNFLKLSLLPGQAGACRKGSQEAAGLPVEPQSLPSVLCHLHIVSLLP